MGSISPTDPFRSDSVRNPRTQLLISAHRVTRNPSLLNGPGCAPRDLRDPKCVVMVELLSHGTHYVCRGPLPGLRAASSRWSAHGARPRALAASSSWEDTNPILRAPPLVLFQTCPQSPPPNTIPLALRASTHKLRDRRHKYPVRNRHNGAEKKCAGRTRNVSSGSLGKMHREDKQQESGVRDKHAVGDGRR